MKGFVAFLIALTIIAGIGAGVWYVSRDGAKQKAASGPSKVQVGDSADVVDEIVAHRFWKKKPTRADVDRIAELATHPGSRFGVYVDANGKVADPTAKTDLDDRHFLFGAIPKPKTKTEAFHQLKKIMDGLMSDENARKEFERKLKGSVKP